MSRFGTSAVDDFTGRFVADLLGRAEGPMNWRFVVQPSVAVVIAMRDALRDSREGGRPYLWAVFTHAGHRRELLRDGMKRIARLFVLACVVDVVYQLAFRNGFHPLEALATAVILALVPYLLLRGPVYRFVRLARGKGD